MDFFLEAFKHHLKRRGSQAALAKKSGVTQSYINNILQERNRGPEDVRRKLAAALGYPGQQYEEFLELGRQIRAGTPQESLPPEPPKEPAPEPELEISREVELLRKIERLSDDLHRLTSEMSAKCDIIREKDRLISLLVEACVRIGVENQMPPGLLSKCEVSLRGERNSDLDAAKH